MKLNAVRIPCRNLQEADAYYENAIGWQKAFGEPSEGYIGYRLGDSIALLEPEEPGEFECGRYLGFSVSVADIAQYYQDALTRGVEFTGPPVAQEWGGVMTHIRDCSGNTFSIVQEGDS